MDPAHVMLALATINTAATLWMLIRDRKGKPRPGRHRRDKRR